MSQKTLLESLPVEVRAIVDSTMNLLALYIPGSSAIEMMVGLNVKATLRFEGAPVSKILIGEVQAHLTRYKKYFPDQGDHQSSLTSSAEKIIGELERCLKEHRDALAVQAAEGA